MLSSSRLRHNPSHFSDLGLMGRDPDGLANDGGEELHNVVFMFAIIAKQSRRRTMQYFHHSALWFSSCLFSSSPWNRFFGSFSSLIRYLDAFSLSDIYSLASPAPLPFLPSEEISVSPPCTGFTPVHVWCPLPNLIP